LGALAVLALLAGCGPDSKTPVKVMVLVYDNATKHYRPQTVELATPTDLVAMEGPVAKILGSAHLDQSEANLSSLPADATLQQVRDAIIVKPGSAVSVSYIEEDGVLIPADFHSLNIATTYYNFERAYEFFHTRIGNLTVESFGTPSVYYFPTFIEKTEPEKDNAAFDPPIGSFLILPFEKLQQVPLAINLGVIGHEYTHSVFNFRVFDQSPIPFPFYEWTSDLGLSTPGFNLLKSLDEGIADTFGTGITCSASFEVCDATYFSESLPVEYGEERRLDADPPHCLSNTLKESLSGLSADTFTDAGYHYEIGSVLSGALWTATRDEGAQEKLGGLAGARRAMFQTLYRALAGSTGRNGLRELILAARGDQTRFRLDSTAEVTGALDAIVQAAGEPALKAALCGAFLGRFKYSTDAIKSCAGASPIAGCSGS